MLAQGARGRLSELAERFSGFEQQVEADTKARKVTEEASIEVVRDGLLRLERALNAEAQARASGQKSLRAAFDAKLSAAQGRLQELFLRQLDRVHCSIDALGDRTGLVERDFLEARARFLRELEGRAAALEQDAADLCRALGGELAERRAAERALAGRADAAAARAAERLAHAARLGEQRCAQLAGDAAEAGRARAAARERPRAAAAAELRAARGRLAAAARARERADEDIAAALGQYTAGLQAALCGVSRGALRAAGQR